jgi:hypothetical protein
MRAEPASAAPTVTATLDDARLVTRQFVTFCNQRRWRELEQLAGSGGDASLRSRLVALVRDAPDFAAGLDRVASAPVASGSDFTTDFVVDLEWRGGKMLAAVRLVAKMQDGGWRLAAFGVSPPP